MGGGHSAICTLRREDSIAISRQSAGNLTMGRGFRGGGGYVRHRKCIAANSGDDAKI